MSNPQWSWMQIGVNEDKNSLFYKDSFGLDRNIPLWSKFGKQEIINRHREIGDRDFNRGYRLIPYSDKDKTFPNFENCCHYGIKPKSVIDDLRDWIFVVFLVPLAYMVERFNILAIKFKNIPFILILIIFY
jgi:hypothetical protein